MTTQRPHSHAERAAEATHHAREAVNAILTATDDDLTLRGDSPVRQLAAVTVQTLKAVEELTHEVTELRAKLDLVQREQARISSRL